jgi:putative transposase
MTELFKNKYGANTTRAAWWDYSSNGGYFLTTCTSNREPYFGSIKDGIMKLSAIGIKANECWQKIPEHYPFVKLDEFVVMPNHIHGIIIIDKISVKNEQFSKIGFDANTKIPVEVQNIIQTQNQANNNFGPQSNNVASIIRGFKIRVTVYCRQNKYPFGWQSRYHDHIIRGDNELNRIRIYIINNPANWSEDKHHRQ